MQHFVYPQKVLSTNAATESTLAAMSAKLPPALGVNALENTLAVNTAHLHSTLNSTTGTLGVGQSWTGVGEDVSAYGVISVAVHSNVASNTLGLEFQASHDNVTWYTSDTYTILANVLKNYSLAPPMRYFRVKYTNDGVSQATFTLETTYRQGYVQPSSHRVGDNLAADDDAMVVQSQIFGLTTGGGGGYRPVKVNPSGALTVESTVTSSALPTGASTLAEQQTQSSTLSAISAKLPASLGEKIQGQSFAVTLNPEIKDAFGRLRVSVPINIYELIMYNSEVLTDDLTSTTASGATIAHDANITSVVSTVTSTIGSKAVIQTFEYIAYKAGRSNLVKITGNLWGLVAGIQKEFGQFDDDNGSFFRLGQDGIAYVVLRSKTSGVVVDTAIPQSAWNGDKLDGTGASGKTYNPAKQYIYFFDYQWQGTGRVRFGIQVEGTPIIIHTFFNSGLNDYPYSQTAVLPIRQSIENISAVVGSKVHMTCLAVDCEGDESPAGKLRTVSNAGTQINFTTIGQRKPLISLRKKAASVKVPIQILEANVFANTTDDFLFEIILNGTLTTPTWVANTGAGEFDVASTAITGGRTIYSNYIRGSTSGASTIQADVARLTRDLSLGVSIAGVSEIISLVTTNLTLNASASAVINYKDVV